MRPRVAIFLLISVFGLAFVRAMSFPSDIEWLKDLSEDETFSAARLTEAERKPILQQVMDTSFDSPDSWLAELRVRQISLGESKGLVIRATRRLCGATGN